MDKPILWFFFLAWRKDASRPHLWGKEEVICGDCFNQARNVVQGKVLYMRKGINIFNNRWSLMETLEIPKEVWSPIISLVQHGIYKSKISVNFFLLHSWASGIPVDILYFVILEISMIYLYKKFLINCLSWIQLDINVIVINRRYIMAINTKITLIRA